jgi:hypothetical protein
MKTIVFFLEEPSVKEMLEGLLPRVLPPKAQVKYLIFRGKQDLEKNLVRKLRGWQLPESVFVIIRDQDSSDCHVVKRRLFELCTQANKGDALIRVAFRELESFYLGDLVAVEKGFGLNGILAKQNKRKYRNPDNLGNPSEELVRLTKGEYQKISGSRAIGPLLDLANNRSHSFNILVTGLRRLAETT